MLNAAFEQWRVAIIRAERQRNFEFRHNRSKYRNPRAAVNVRLESALLKSLVNFALLRISRLAFPSISSTEAIGARRFS